MTRASVKTTALIVDGAYARIQDRNLGGKVDFVSLRAELEELTASEFEECWYFDSQRSDARGNSALASEYHALKFARPLGPQFQVEVFCTKPYKCHCTKCGHRFTQNVQKGVDDAISLKLLTLTLANEIERVILFSGDGDFHGSLGHVRNILRREVWVVGFWGTVSGDLQQLASRVIWVNDLWGRIQHQGRRERRNFGALPSTRIGSLGREVSYSSHFNHQPSHRSKRRRHPRSKRRKQHDQSRGNERSGALNIYGPARSHRSLSPCRKPISARHYRSPSPPRVRSPEIRFQSLSSHHDSDSDRGQRMLSPRQGGMVVGEPLFDDVNLSGSDEEDNGSFPSLLASPRASEPDVASTPSSMQEPALHVNGDQRLNFPLPMAVPVATSTPTSAE